MIEVSIICPTFNEERFIESCIQSILHQDLPTTNWELLIVDGESTDKTRELVRGYLEQYSNIRLLDNPHRTAPYAMNIGIKSARGEYVVRIDAHVGYPLNYISTLVNYLHRYPEVKNVGCACITEPRSNTKKAKAIAEVLANRFGVGGSQFRLGVTKVMEVDTVPFGCFRKADFETFGYYDERLTRNQDIELNNRIRQSGGKILLIPDINCTYYSRDTYSELIRNNYGNGKWNILTVYYTHNFKSLSLRHFVPLLFILSIILPLCFIPLWWSIASLAIASLAVYTIMICCISFRIALTKRLNFILLCWAFVVLHISYGLGSLLALIQLPFLKR